MIWVRGHVVEMTGSWSHRVHIACSWAKTSFGTKASGHVWPRLANLVLASDGLGFAFVRMSNGT